MKRKILSLALALALCLGMFPAVASAAGGGYEDTAGHWAESAIERWSEYRIVEGNGNSFQPDQPLTRGQMAKILANTLGLTDEGTAAPFTDVPGGAWYAPYVLRCYAAGIMMGSGDKARPEAPLTRQEAMVLLGRALGIAPAEGADLSGYPDGGAVADWAAPYVAAMTQAGIVNGVSGGQLAPMGDMTRGSIMVVLDRAVAQYIAAPGTYELADTDGIILVAAGDVTLTGKTAGDILVTPAAAGKALTFDKAQVTGSITVQADGAKVVSKNGSTLPEIVALGKDVAVESGNKKPTASTGGTVTPPASTYADLTIETAQSVTESATYQDVTITAGVADGTVTLANLTINGDLTIQGGGSNSIHLQNCIILGKIIMAKLSGAAPRLHLTNTPVTTVEADKPAIIEADADSTVATVQAKANVEIKGTNTAITTVAVPTGVETAVTVTVTAGAVSKVEAKSETTVTGAAGSVAQVVAEAKVTVASDTVEKVEVPPSASQSVAVAVTGTGNVEVAVNSESGAAITTDAAGEEEAPGANVKISSTLTTPPSNVTLDNVAVTHIHKWDAGVEAAAPTCTAAGRKTYTCTADGCDTDSGTEGNQVATKAETIPAKGHDWNAWAKTSDTEHTRTCKRDGTHTETAAHTFGDWVSVDTANHKHTCSVCSGEVTAPHTAVEDAAVEATCTTEGKTAGSHCSDCNAVITAQTTVAALGHDWGAWANASEAGHTHTCTRDASHTETVAHTFGDWEYVSNLNHKHTCTVCSYEMIGTHTLVVDVGVAATCTTEGKSEGTHCSVCNTTVTAQTTVAALGHDFNTPWQQNTNGHWHKCSRCDATDEKAAHTYTDGVCECGRQENTPGAEVGTITLTQEDPWIYANWADYGHAKYYLQVVDSSGNAEFLDRPSGTKSEVLNSSMPRPTQAGTYSYTLELYAVGEDNRPAEVLARLEDAFVVTVSGTAVDYDMAFNHPEMGQHTITVKAAVQGSVGNLNGWYEADGRLDNRGWGGGEIQAGERYENRGISDGMSYDLRALTAFALQEGSLHVTMTPPSVKTYVRPTPTNTIQFTTSGKGVLCLNWDYADPANMSEVQSIKVQFSADGGSTWTMEKSSWAPSDTKLWLTGAFVKPGTYNKVRIMTGTGGPQDTEWFTANCNLTVSSEVGTAEATFTPGGTAGVYDVSVTGLPEGGGFYEISYTDDVSYGMQAASGHGFNETAVTDTDDDERIPNGYYRIDVFRNASADGTTGSVTMQPGTWAKCIGDQAPSGS